MLHKSFHRGLHKLIKKIEYEMYIVNVDRNYTCTCLGKEANEGDPNCPKCLGTGYKIKIRKILGIKQPYKTVSKGASGAESLSSAVSRYYIDDKYGPVKNGDLMFVKDEIDVIKLARKHKIDSTIDHYFECSAVLKKYNTKTIYKNFLKLIGEA